ncbi:Pkinase-domain-containing protein [Fomitiporia mediterranea MF3/22]|uniref:Pkinase-domain-containing protein n=1 Tax=Fomitiporia mediterranea (strain MF3/22) TaxID=694068 RepID=UPI00044097DC|nr:Pkinase-domain-containing protein [Fomitiporia mediterranea MF3/22]EJD04806.1 Pkinase-domain-containing protein [Fomitiporia mediterranea MF3/22]
MSRTSSQAKHDIPPLENLKPLFRHDEDPPEFDNIWLWAKDEKDDRKPCRFKRTRELGKGAYAVVWLIERDDIQEDMKLEFAAKVVSKRTERDGKELTDKQIKHRESFTKNEARVLARLRHKNVIICYGAFENEHSFVTILEYARGGDLFKRLQEAGRFTERDVAHYIQ